MQYVDAAVSEEEAIQFFNRRRFGNLYGLLRWRSLLVSQENNRARILPYIERVWMPYYLVDIQIVSGKEYSIQTASIEAYSGAFALFEMHEALREGALDELWFPPGMTEQEALDNSRRDMVRVIMRRRGGMRNKLVIEQAVCTGIFYYPFWVCYRKRGKGIDVQLQDAISGERGGARNRIGFLNAMIARRRRKTGQEKSGKEEGA